MKIVKVIAKTKAIVKTLSVSDQIKEEFGFVLSTKDHMSLEKVLRGTPGEPGLKPEELLNCAKEELLSKELIETEFCCDCLILTEKGRHYLRFVSKLVD